MGPNEGNIPDQPHSEHLKPPNVGVKAAEPQRGQYRNEGIDIPTVKLS